MSTLFTHHCQLRLLVPMIAGCLLVIGSFAFLNWNTAWDSSPLIAWPYLNGVGVFQTIADTYGVIASLWLWITPVAAITALVFTCVGWLWNDRLLPLTALLASVGFVPLIHLVGIRGIYNYTSAGYWLSVLGLLIMLIYGWYSQYKIRETYQGVLIWCGLVGGSLVLICFFLPWIVLNTPFLPHSTYLYDPARVLYIPLSGFALATNSFSVFPPNYPEISPEGYWLLWLVPLIGVLGVSTAWKCLHGQYMSRWLWLLLPVIPVVLFRFLLSPIVGGFDATDGWDLTLQGLTLMFMCGLLWKKEAQEENVSPQPQPVRRRLLTGIAGGLITVVYGSYLFVHTSKMYRTIQSISFSSDHSSSNAVAWSPDGKQLAFTDANTIQIWDTLAIKQKHKWKYKSSSLPTALAWSPDQRFVAVVDDVTAYIFESATEKLVSQWQVGVIKTVSWSADSQRVATISGTNDDTVEIHNAMTGNLVWSRQSSSGEYLTLAWSPWQPWLAVGELGRNVGHQREVFLNVWDIPSGTSLLKASSTPLSYWGYQSLNGTVAWSPDGKQLAFSMQNNTGVQLWDVSSKKLLRTYIGSGGGFSHPAWSPDGRYIAVAENTKIRIWDTTTGQTRFNYLGVNEQDTIYWVSWSPQGNYIAVSSSYRIRIWQLDI